MPCKYEPVSLERLAMVAVGEWVKMVGRGLIEPMYVMMQRDPNQGQLLLQRIFALIREMLYANVPWYLFDKMAVQVLTGVSELINETKSTYDNYKPMAVYLHKMKVVVSLSEVALHPHLRKINISHWPKIMRHVLYQNLTKLVGLEELNLGSGSAGWDISEIEKLILVGVESMSNLTTFCLCFDCTDAIVNVIGNNCHALCKLDITASRSVTDRCIPSLLNCKKLTELNLYHTSVTVAGFTELLSKHPSIQDLGRCDEFGSVLEKLSKQKSSPLSLLSLQCKDMSDDHLKLLIEFCPKMTSVSVFHDERIADLTILSQLQNLKDLKVLSCDFFTDRVKELLELRGDNLDYLHLEHVEEIDLNALIYISQLCPRLKTLMLYNCEFVDHRMLYFNLKRLAVPPFAHLERLVCVSECDLDHLEFLMSHCTNIQYIQLGSSTGINDATMKRILDSNKMKHLKELKILYSGGLSMATVNMLMEYCDQLHTLSELESWEGISELELENFREYIHTSNINLDIRPTLSYT